MNKIVALLILPLVATIYATAPSIFVFVGAMSKVTAALGG